MKVVILECLLLLSSVLVLSQFVYSFFPSGGREILMLSLSLSILSFGISLIYLLVKGRDKVFLFSNLLNCLPWVFLLVILVVSWF
jgi:hypothetical protein